MPLRFFIMLTPQGHTVLIDFGAARLFTPDKIITHTVIATYGFAPPEQFYPKARRGPFSDIYSLAVTCHYLLTGDLPDPDIDRRLKPSLRAAIEHATAYDPAARPQTVAAFLAELRADVLGADRKPTIETTPTDIADLIHDIRWGLDEQEPPAPTSDWQVIPAPVGNTMNSVSFVSPDEAWAAGEAGMMLHYLRGEWQAVDTTAANLFAVQMLSEGAGWAVGDTSMMQYQRGNWHKLDISTLSTTETLNSVHMFTPDEGWAVGRRGIIVRCQAGQWEVVPHPLRPFAARNEYGFMPAISDVYGIPDLNGVCMLNEAEGWAVGDDGLILYYRDGAWQSVTSPTNQTLQAVQMLSPADGWAAGWRGTILHYDGYEWRKVECPNEAYLFGLHMWSVGEGWAVGSTGNILRCVAGIWREVVSPTAEPLRAVWAASEDEAWALGYFGYILHYLKTDKVRIR